MRTRESDLTRAVDEFVEHGEHDGPARRFLYSLVDASPETFTGRDLVAELADAKRAILARADEIGRDAPAEAAADAGDRQHDEELEERMIASGVGA